MTQTAKLIDTTYILIVLTHIQLTVCTQMHCQNQINMLMLNNLCLVLFGWESQESNIGKVVKRYDNLQTE